MACGYAVPSTYVAEKSVDWWHRVELPGCYVAPRIDEPITTLEALRLPDLTGKSVLQVGARDGYLSFAAERLGAARVVALDTTAWRRPGGKVGFEYARRALASQVEDVEIEISDISLETLGEFDVVLLCDVLHYLHHPLSALERLAEITRERLIVETLTDVPFPRSPAAALYPWNARVERAKWAPNRAALLAILRNLGFDHTVAFPAKRVPWGRLRSLPVRVKSGIDLLAMTPRSLRPGLRRDLVRSLTTQNRLVAHAWRTLHP